MDGALAIARMIVRGVLEKFPTLKVVGTHLGGGICEMIGRMDYAYTLGDEVYFLGRYEPMLINHKPSHYLKMMYLESTSYWVPGARWNRSAPTTSSSAPTRHRSNRSRRRASS